MTVQGVTIFMVVLLIVIWADFFLKLFGVY